MRLQYLSAESTRQRERISDMQHLAQDLKQQAIEFQTLSRYDRLTGVMNRSGLHEVIDTAFPWRISSDIAILIVDVDHFKKINDTLGHEAGDLVLTRVGGVLLDATSATDTVARWGGEEFVLLCPNTTKIGAKVLAEKVRKKIEEVEIKEKEITGLTVSLGVTLLQTDETFECGFNRADEAM